MDLRLLYFQGCPHSALAEERLRAALSSLGRGEDPVTRVLVETTEEAEDLGFIGSPTVLVDGRDPFAHGGEPSALACRVYATPDGPGGSPTVDMLIEALS